MRGHRTFTAALALAAFAAPASADERADQLAVTGSVLHFFDMMAKGTRAQFADTMTPGAVFTVHDQRDPDKARVTNLTQADYLANWAKRTAPYQERMLFNHVLIAGDMAHVWGPYTFKAGGRISHCGINSIHLIRGADRVWKLGNGAFTMVTPERCKAVGAPEAPAP